MRRGTWLVLILLVMSVPQAWATCVQCPNPPCEVQECPPDELATFANMIVAGETVGIGEEVELDDNASITVVDMDEDDDLGMILEVDIDGAHNPEFDADLQLVYDLYEPNGGGWSYVESTDPVTLLSFTTGTGQGTCEGLQDSYCAAGGVGVGCIEYSCSRAKYCEASGGYDEYCILASGTCVTKASSGSPPVNYCSGCSVTSEPPCALGEDHPSQYIRATSCPRVQEWEMGIKCRLKLVWVAEGR